MALIRPSAPGDTSASRIADQRVREWILQLDSQRQRLEQSADKLAQDVHPYVAISREEGSGGVTIARRVGELLKWEVLHRELLDQMAEKYKLRREMLAMVDEKTSNWILEIFGKWLDPRVVTQSEYIVHLGQTVLLAARHASSVFVGRGAQFFLPAERGVNVFLVAPMAMRVAHIRQAFQCSESDARRHIRETDKGRRDLIKTTFSQEMGDPHLYDLVINRRHTSVDEAAEMIVSLCRRRFSIT